MKCRECDCEMKPVQLQGCDMLVTSGRFAGRLVESMVCPICGNIELRVKMPAGMREAAQEDWELRKLIENDK